MDQDEDLRSQNVSTEFERLIYVKRKEIKVNTGTFGVRRMTEVRNFIGVSASLILVLACCQIGGGADKFSLSSETLASNERMEIYLRLIEDFVGWGESTGKFINSDLLGPNGGFFDGAGNGVTWFRGNSNMCIVYAVLLSEFPDRQHFTRYNIPRAVLLDHLRKTIRSLCLSNKNCSRYMSASHSKVTRFAHPRKFISWGGPSWQASLGVIGPAWAVHLMEESIDAETQALVTEVLAKEADNLDKPIPTARTGDTASEDCCWNAPALAFAANKLANDPRAKRWDKLARRWALNSVSMAGDRESEEIVDGRPLREWMASENIFADLTLENHHFWSVPYQFEYQLLGEAEIAYKAFGNDVPEAFGYRAEAMWKAVNGVLSLWDGDSLFPHGQDWAWKDYQHFEYFCWQSTCLNNLSAGAFESRALQMLLKRQMSDGTGSFEAYDFGYQTHLAKKCASSYLMHKYFPVSETVSFDKAQAELLGVHVYPWVKTAIHRTEKKLVSVAWHRRSHAVFILPEGSSTFADPPFFFPYDRYSGSAKVKIKPKRDIKKSAPSLELVEPTHDGNGMRITVRRPCENDAVTQYITVVSLPDEATIYSTIFQAHVDAEVQIGPLFALKTSAPPGFKRPVKQYRGKNWLNMSEHVAFVSSEPLPENIPAEKFYLTENRVFNVKQGQWFSLAAVVVYVRQKHQQAARSAESVKLVKNLKNKEFTLIMHSSSGRSKINLWPNPSSKP